jgi:hypothetical protein
MGQITTAQDVAIGSARGGDFYILLGDFLDEFYRSDNIQRRQMIELRPVQTVHPGKNQMWVVYLAAAVHKLANDFNLPVPDWVFEPDFYAEKPIFGGNAKGNLRWLFMYKSPPEFKHRNLFVCENVLRRV